MRPTLILQPIHSSSSDILKCFAGGKPLSPEQLNYLDWHQSELSNKAFDPVMQYYLKSIRDHRRGYKSSFLLPHEELNLADVQQLRKRILALLQNKNDITHVVINLTPKQFIEFKNYTIQDLIYWHGNHFLTGDAFYPGGITPIILFQWGNLLGIVKYVVLPGEKELKANVLIYFEDMQERTLDLCAENYYQKLQTEIELQNKILHEKKIELPHETNKTAPVTETLLKTPQLKISDHFLVKHL